MKRIGKGNADRRWDVLPQQPALAYDMAQNRLIATAAVLQPPVFDSANPAMAYGAYGALVGNQLTRAVDARGSLVDAQGQMRSWWSAEDRAAWNQLGQRVATQYATYAYPGVAGAQDNGTLVKDQSPSSLSGPELA